MVEFKANVNIKGESIYSGSISDDCFCAFVEKKEEGEEACEKGQFYCCFNMGESSIRALWAGVESCEDGVG